MWRGFVKAWDQLWLLYNQAKKWGTTPASLLGVSDAYLAYCLNNATYTFGSALEAELESVTGKKDAEIKRKRQRIMDKWLDRPMKFRSPVAPTTTRRESDV